MEGLNMKTIPSFGYEIIRDHLLHSILGKHEEDVLYWAGYYSIVIIKGKGVVKNEN